MLRGTLQLTHFRPAFFLAELEVADEPGGLVAAPAAGEPFGESRSPARSLSRRDGVELASRLNAAASPSLFDGCAFTGVVAAGAAEGAGAALGGGAAEGAPGLALGRLGGGEIFSSRPPPFERAAAAPASLPTGFSSTIAGAGGGAGGGGGGGMPSSRATNAAVPGDISCDEMAAAAAAFAFAVLGERSCEAAAAAAAAFALSTNAFSAALLCAAASSAFC